MNRDTSPPYATRETNHPAAPRPSPVPRRGRRGGYTLVEMAVSCAIVAVLMLAVASALHLTLSATADVTAAAALNRENGSVADQVGSDLNLALDFTERTATAVTFSVPDRAAPGDADRGPDTIRYAWWPTGSPADLTTDPPTDAIPAYALTRQYNGGPVRVFARDVRDFRLDYLTRSVAAATVGPRADKLYVSHDPSGGTSREYFPTGSNWAAQVFKPNITATKWTVTRVRLYCKGDAAPDGVLRVQFRTASSLSNIPGSVLEEVEVSELAFDSSYGFVDVRFNNLKDLSTSAKYAVVVVGTGSTTTTSSYGWVQSGSPPADTYFTTTTNAGATWATPSSANSMRYYVYGRTD